jgi:phosphatidylinositol alpha-mannosyltransferase
MVSQSYPPLHGGVAEHVHHLSSELARRGHEVTVFTGGPEISGGLPQGGAKGSAEPAVVQGGPAVLRFGRTVRVPCNGGSGCVIVGRPRLKQLFRERSFDIMHVHTPLVPTLPLAALRSFEGPVVATFHSAGRPHWGYRAFGRVLRPYFARIDERIAVSRAAVDFVAPFFPGEYRIIPNGVDPGRFRPSALPDERHFLTVLAVGRLDPRKGIGDLLDALPLFRDRAGRKVRCLIAGDGPLMGKLRRKARHVPVPVTFLGAVERERLPDIYRLAHIVVAPARYSESFGVVLLEALASGRPVVASDVRGYGEVLENCAGALVFRSGSVGDLADKMAGAASPPVMDRLSREGPRFAERFHWPAVAGEIEEVYASAVGLRSTPARVLRNPRESVLVPTEVS